MKKRKKWIVSGSVGLVIFLLLFQFYLSNNLKKMELSCGIECLFYVCKKFGINIDKSEIMRFRAYSKMKENNMYQLFDEIKKKGLHAVGMKISLEDMVKLNTISIAHLWTDHFVVIEPTYDENKIRIYDPLNKKTKEVHIKKFKNYYSGFCLLISKNEINIQVQKEIHPDIRFDVYVYNFKEIEEGNKIPFKFVFTNIGKERLKILNIRSSCGCIVINTDKKDFQKGEKGIIKGIFNTTGRKGFQKETIFVHTNDPITPIINLTIEGFVMQKICIIPEIIRFGEIEKGEKKEKEVYIINPKKDRKFKIEKIESNLSSILRWAISKSTIKTRPGYKIKFYLQNEPLPEEIKGEVVIFTNDKSYSKFIIPVIGKVKKEIEVYPELCFFYGRKNFENIKITIKNPINNKIEKIESTTFFINPIFIPLNDKEYEMKILLNNKYPKNLIKEKIILTYTDSENSGNIEIPVYGIVERR
ncbi:MAG: DUF1573 domain-containing protein [Candidatus Ratteibacteria bacterium]